MKTFWYDNNTIQIFRGCTGWCFTVTLPNGKKSGGMGYGSHELALNAARNK